MLPVNFKPKKNFNLIRLGNRYDGGYLIDEFSIKKSEILISAGIFYDFKFESDYIVFTNNKAYCYDHTIKPFRYMFHWLLIFLKRFFFFESYSRLKKAFKTILKPIKFLKFINKNNVIYEKKGIGIDSKNIYSLGTILKKISLDKQFYLKVDIEGDEYKILDQIIFYSKNLTGLAIEFHEVKKNLNLINSFINNLPLELIYIHPNNAGLLDDEGDPQLVEMTFSKYATVKDNMEFSKHELDCPNNPYKNDVVLKFSN